MVQDPWFHAVLYPTVPTCTFSKLKGTVCVLLNNAQSKNYIIASKLLNYTLHWYCSLAGSKTRANIAMDIAVTVTSAMPIRIKHIQDVKLLKTLYS